MELEKDRQLQSAMMCFEHEEKKCELQLFTCHCHNLLLMWVWFYFFFASDRNTEKKIADQKANEEQKAIKADLLPSAFEKDRAVHERLVLEDHMAQEQKKVCDKAQHERLKDVARELFRCFLLVLMIFPADFCMPNWLLDLFTNFFLLQESKSCSKRNVQLIFKLNKIASHELRSV